MKKRYLVPLVIFMFLSGTILLFRILLIDINFMIETTRTGDFPEYDNIIEVVNDFDYDAELNLLLNDYPNKMSNYCSPALFDDLTAGIQENRKWLWWKPFYRNYIRHRIDLDFLNSFNMSCILGRYGDIYFGFNSTVHIFNETHGVYEKSQYTIKEPHFYLNESYLPDFLSHPIDEREMFPTEDIENIVPFSNIYVMSLDLLYDIGEGVFTASGYSMEQKVFLSAELDIIAIFVYEMWHFVA